MPRIRYSQSDIVQLAQKNAGMESSQLKELKALQEENLRLKHMFAELSLDYKLAKEIIEKKS
jgi:putative transposase